MIAPQVTADNYHRYNYHYYAEHNMLNNHQILRVKHLAKQLGVSRSTIYNWLDKNSKYYKADFPKPIPLSLRAKGWIKYEIDIYLEEASKRANKLEVQNQ